MNRRDLLKSGPAAALAAAVPVTAAATVAASPIPALFHAWSALHKEANTADLSEEEATAAINRLHELDRAIMHHPSQNAEDLLMKIAAFTSWGDFEISDCPYAKADIIWNEMRALTGVQV